jgi:nitroreductase
MSVHKEDAKCQLTAIIENRWSPRAFSSQEMTEAQAIEIFEAIRWSPSCMNDQPWRIQYAFRQDQDGFAKLFSCLSPGNAWAKQAALLFLISSEKNFGNGEVNGYAGHDVGIALGQALAQITAMGLHAHLMAGFDQNQAKTVLALSESQQPWTMVAVGHLGELSQLSDTLQQRELATRKRKSYDLLVHQVR